MAREFYSPILLSHLFANIFMLASINGMWDIVPILIAGDHPKQQHKTSTTVEGAVEVQWVCCGGAVARRSLS
jgi:hypothetical protein